MFEREITDAMFIQRWGIVRTLIPQSVAEHTFAVTHYANDIACFLDFGPQLHLAVMQYAIWHDSADEIFTSDLPGPNKRGLLDAIGPDAKKLWEAKLKEWADHTFSNLNRRRGGSLDVDAAYTLLLTIKTADWLESAVKMATEAQMGNQCAVRHIVPNMNGALETAKRLCEHVFGVKMKDEVPLSMSTGSYEHKYFDLISAIERCVSEAQHGQSLGPWITREDQNRTYHDPCVDSKK